MDTTLTEAGRLLAASRSIVITTHLMPDGDGLGAEIALYHYLARLGKKVRVINPDVLPDRYRFIDKAGAIEVHGSGTRWERFDLAVVVDTNDPLRLGGVWNAFEAHAGDILFLDHHPNLEGAHIEGGARPPARLNVHTVVDVRSSSIGEMLYRLFHLAHDQLDPSASAFRLSPEIALGLYVSIITDTNSFRYSRTTALSHRIAADLIDFGLQPEEIYQNVYSSKSVEHLRLIGEILRGVQEIHALPGGRTIAWVEIPRDTRTKFGATSDDTQAVVNFLLLLKNAEILMLLREEDDGRIKVSLKSRGMVGVNGVAREFGGGGHEFAAGFVAEGRIDEIRERLIARLRK